VFNFEVDDPPVNPMTGRPVDRWYKPGESWYGVFGADANGVEECRAEGVGAALRGEQGRARGVWLYRLLGGDGG
jgi:dipeptidyl-peptidase-3